MSEHRADGQPSRVTVENVNHPGRTSVVDGARYRAVREAMVAVLPATVPGLKFEEMLAALARRLPFDLFPGGAKAGWWAKTVQLDLEAKNVIVRESTTPLRWHCVESRERAAAAEQRAGAEQRTGAAGQRAARARAAAGSVVLADIPVLCVVANGGLDGVSEAWERLEASLSSLKGRRFYGTFLEGEYRACVARRADEDPAALGLAEGTIPGGAYVSRRIRDWPQHVREIGETVLALAGAHDVDPARPAIEYYRSHSELVVYVPVVAGT